MLLGPQSNRPEDQLENLKQPLRNTLSLLAILFAKVTKVGGSISSSWSPLGEMVKRPLTPTGHSI